MSANLHKKKHQKQSVENPKLTVVFLEFETSMKIAGVKQKPVISQKSLF